MPSSMSFGEAAMIVLHEDAMIFAVLIDGKIVFCNSLAFLISQVFQ